MAADIANAIAMTLTHSQIDTVRFQSAPLPRLNCQGTGDVPLQANAHGATRFTGKVAQCLYIANNRMLIAPAVRASVAARVSAYVNRSPPLNEREPGSVDPFDLDQAVNCTVK